MSLIKKFLKRLRRSEKGSILVEIAISMPLYFGLLASMFEIGNYLILHMKVQHSVVTIADLVTRDETISEAIIADIFAVVPAILAPYQAGGNTVTIISAISQTEDIASSVFWQRSGGGTMVATSELGAEGGPALLPPIITMRDNETVLVVEVFYQFSPLVFPFMDDTTIRRVSYYRPRIGSLTVIEE